MKHFLNLMPHPPELLRELLASAAKLKKAHAAGKNPKLLCGKVVGMVFEKPSLRTRVSFEAGIAQMGGQSIFIQGAEVQLGIRESLADFSRTMSEFIDALVMRVFRQSTCDEVAQYSRVPVINGLSDLSHPCQAMADFMTIEEVCGTLAKKHLVFVGDGNNVAKSLAVGCGKLGMKFTLACPEGYGFDDPFKMRYAKVVSREPLVEIHDPVAAVTKADVIYTDVWTSMGQEAEREQRMGKFAAFQVNEALLAHAPKETKIMHCLPAHRGEEITHEVFESKASVVFPQAGNRMHVQKAIFEWLFS